MPVRTPVKFDNELVLIGETYYYRGTPLGTTRRREISLGISLGASQKDVLLKKREMLEKLERAGSNSGKSAFRVITQDYLKDRTEEHSSGELSDQALYESQHIIRDHLSPYFGGFKVEEIDQDAFEDFCREDQIKKLNVTNTLKVLNHFLKWCSRKKYLRARPELFIPKFAKKKRRERVVLTDAEILAFLKSCDGPLLLYVSMYLLMGMRNMEITRLRWDEIDFSNQTLFVNPLNNRKRQKRAIPINRNVMALLKRTPKASEWVFPAFQRGTKAAHASNGWHRKAWDLAKQKSGITRHITPHDLRATFETFMHQNPDFTDTQREKMAGAKIDVQKTTYVKLEASKLRGLENSVNVSGISEIFGEKLGEKQPKKKASKRLTNRKKAIK